MDKKQPRSGKPMLNHGRATDDLEPSGPEACVGGAEPGDRENPDKPAAGNLPKTSG